MTIGVHQCDRHFITFDTQAGSALLHGLESILDLQQFAGPAESCEGKAVRRIAA